MRRTMIIIIECEGANAWRITYDAETDLLDHIDTVASQYTHREDCVIDTQLLVVPLSDTLIDKLCNKQPE